MKEYFAFRTYPTSYHAIYAYGWLKELFKIQMGDLLILEFESTSV